MDIDLLKSSMSREVYESLKERGIISLNDPQKKAIAAGLLLGKNILVASPTASGKTLIAELAIMRAVGGGRKAVYIAPMRALAGEKYEEFKRHYPYLKVALSIGDLDSLDHWLSNYDIIFASTEKFDSLVRHGADWLGSVGCIVIDEVHMLDDVGRGPTLEILITKLRRECSDAQIVSLSATVGNPMELAQWLGAGLVESSYRPVMLEKGILLGDTIYYRDGGAKLKGRSKLPETRLVEDTVSSGKQAIIFYSTKRSAEAGAERIRQAVSTLLSDYDRAALADAAQRITAAIHPPTAKCEKLAGLIRHGVAFHHAGLVNEQRKIVEDSFREYKIKTICATTTLGYGVNLPAHTVLVRDTTRFGAGWGERIGVNEITQLMGRAGRPAYDTSGRALLIAKTKGDIQKLYERYIDAELEPVESKLGVLPALRSHVLAFISGEFLHTKESMLLFFMETFYGYQFGSTGEMNEIIDAILGELVEWEFVVKEGSVYRPTRLGKRVSELYIDPLTGRRMVLFLSEKRQKEEIGDLFMITNTVEMRPYIRATREVEDRFQAYGAEVQAGLLEDASDPLGAFATAVMLHDWIDELGESEIMKKYGTTPGALNSKITNAIWLLYSAIELAKIARADRMGLMEINVRMRYGIKKELVDLVRLRGIGRVRARALYDGGIRSVSELRKKESAQALHRILGKEIAESVLAQVQG